MTTDRPEEGHIQQFTSCVCGGRPAQVIPRTGLYLFRCQSCGRQTAGCDTSEKAVGEWNAGRTEIFTPADDAFCKILKGEEANGR